MADKNISKILAFLKDKGYQEKHNISPILNEMFPFPTGESEYIVNQQMNRVVRFLNAMGNTNDNYIEYNEVGFDLIHKHKDQPEESKIWFGIYPFSASITSDGLAYMENIEKGELEEMAHKSAIKVNESIEATNQSVLTTNNALIANAGRQSDIMEKQTDIYRNTLRLTFVNIAIGAGILYATLSSNYDKQELILLKTQLSQKDKEIHQLQYLKFYQVPFVKDSFQLKNAPKKK